LQTNSNAQITVVAATPNNKIQTSHPIGIYANQASPVTLGPTVSSADMGAWGTDCSNPSTWVGGGGLNGMQQLSSGSPGVSTFTISSTHIGYKLCYRNSDGTDSIEQTGIKLQVVSQGGLLSDPISWYGNERHVFQLPPHTLTSLMHADDMELWGETFFFGGEWQQWFGRMVIASIDGSRWVQVSIKKNILEFNRSKIPQHAQGDFETLDIMLGHGPIDNPAVTTVVTNPDVQMPLNFLGFEVAFWKMPRNANAANTMIGAARRECMEVAGANIHFYVCSAGAHEFYGWQRDLSIINAHLDFHAIEMLNGDRLKGFLPELWGFQPMSAKTKECIVDEKASAANTTGLEVPELPQSSLAKGKAWAGGGNHKDLLQSCAMENQTGLSCTVTSVEAANESLAVNII
jgi:hypothetical protein